MTRKEIANIKYKLCCPMCDNPKCVKGTDKCESEKWAKSKVDAENAKKQVLIDLMKDMPLSTLQIAFVYAKNYAEYGEDVTKTWLTVTENASALEKAYRKGYYEGLKRQAESED